MFVKKIKTFFLLILLTKLRTFFGDSKHFFINFTHKIKNFFLVIQILSIIKFKTLATLFMKLQFAKINSCFFHQSFVMTPVGSRVCRKATPAVSTNIVAVPLNLVPLAAHFGTFSKFVAHWDHTS